MKKIFLSAFVLGTMIACEKSPAPAYTNSSIIGKWKLSETYSDPGDGSGKWQQADPLNPRFLTFNSDGNLNFIPTALYSADHFKLTSDSTLFFYRGSDSVFIRYTFTETLLSIYPPCDEGCGERYIPAL